jgi:hypothetical protein
MTTDSTGFLDQVRAALDDAARATTPEQRRRALGAIKGVQGNMERRRANELDLELAAVIANKSWSNARVNHLSARLAAARAELEGAV